MIISQGTTAQRNALVLSGNTAIWKNTDNHDIEFISDSGTTVVFTSDSAEILINSVDKLPAPNTNNERVLQNNKTYRFKGVINIGDTPIVCGNSNVLMGFDKSDDGIIYTGTGAAIRATNNSLIINSLSLSAPNGTILDLQNQNTHSFQMKECIIEECQNVGVVNNGFLVNFDSNIINSTVSGGCIFTGNIQELSIDSSYFLNATSPILIALSALTANTIKINNNVFKSNSSNTSVIISSVTVTQNGKVINNSFNGDGIPLTGIDSDDIKWELEANGSSLIPTTGGFSPNGFKILTDDFMYGTNENGEIGDLGWSYSNGNISLIASQVGHPGLIQRGTNNNSVTSLFLRNAASTTLLNYQDFYETIYILQSSSSSGNITLRAGLSSDANSVTPINGIYFEKLATDTNWFAVSRSSSVQTRVDTGIVYSPNTWYKLHIISDKVRNILIYKINNDELAIIDTNIPSSANLNVFSHIIRAGTSNISYILDFFSLIYKTQNR